MLCVSAIWFYAYSIYAARDLFSSVRAIDPGFCPPISILKPIRGLDTNAYENLASICRQEYPLYQIVFGVRDDRDPGLDVVRRIVTDFPQIDIRIVMSRRLIGANLKVSNLANMVAEASYPLLLISDSDIRVGSDYLRRVVQPMRNSEIGRAHV